MKILSTAWTIFTYNGNAYEIKRNGGSIMIADICDYIGRTEDSYLFVGSERVPRMDYGNIHVIDNGAYLPERRMVNNIGEWHEGLKKAFRECIDTIDPDYVLVQGGMEFSSNCMEICKEIGQKYAFVDHLFQGNQDVAMNHKVRTWEDKVFADSTLNVIAVSTNMRRRILNTYPNLDPRKIIAIPNGTPYMMKEDILRNFRQELKLGDKKILLCSGSLQPRKNQMQLVNAFKLLKKETQQDVVILFCGNDSLKYPTRQKLEDRISREGLNESLIYIGTFSREEMHDLYASVDALIMPSLNEGLSLVALEALVYGKPVIMFSDNETAGDVNDSCATVMVDAHSDEALAKGIEEWYGRSWNTDKIMEYSKYFNMERVAEEYLKYIRGRL